MMALIPVFVNFYYISINKGNTLSLIQNFIYSQRYAEFTDILCITQLRKVFYSTLSENISLPTVFLETSKSVFSSFDQKSNNEKIVLGILFSTRTMYFLANVFFDFVTERQELQTNTIYENDRDLSFTIK